jgi:hypothetical protein
MTLPALSTQPAQTIPVERPVGISADELLRRSQKASNEEFQNSSLGRYRVNASGMLAKPIESNFTWDMPKLQSSQMSSHKTPEQPQPESGGMSVMCTLMREYGYLEDDVFIADTLYGNLLEQTNPEIIVGYHAWAKPFANFLRHHAIFIPLFAYITQAWAYEMCEHLGVTKNRSTFQRLLGKIVMNVGKSVCGFIGKTILSMQGVYEYRRT